MIEAVAKSGDIRVLIVDDEAGIRAFLSDVFRGEGWTVDTAADAPSALAKVLHGRFDLVFSDIMMPGDDGIELLRELRTADPELPVVLITGYPSVETAVKGLRHGAADYVTKPFAPEEIRIVARRALEHRALRDENRRFRTQVARRWEGRIVAESEPMRRVMSLTEKLANSDATVLVTGESGTGKDLIARAIHFTGQRRDREFLPLNCGAIPENLIESELFGHAKGSFTGAHRRKEGTVARADRGTLFLDEIGEMPASLQPKLLRFLQSGEFQEVGGTKTERVDVRVIAATNRDLEADVASGRFRADLFYRLNVIRVHVPALRERPEDVPVLVARFLESYAARRPGAPRRIAEDAMGLLRAHPWPGNVRELENAIERALVLASGDVLTRKDFAFLSRPDSLPGGGPYPFGNLPLAEMERLHIASVIEACQGNHSAAAGVLGIHRTTIWKKLKELSRS